MVSPQQSSAGVDMPMLSHGFPADCAQALTTGPTASQKASSEAIRARLSSTVAQVTSYPLLVLVPGGRRITAQLVVASDLLVSQQRAHAAMGLKVRQPIFALQGGGGAHGAG